MLRIGLLTSGGDCQALNATMRGIVKTLETKSARTISRSMASKTATRASSTAVSAS